MALISVAPGNMSMRNHFFITLMILSILSLGCYFSMINLLNKEWLSRSGSLIVVLGILYGFSAIIEERVLMSRLSLRKRIELLQKKRKLRRLQVAAHYIEEELLDIEEKFTAHANESMNSIKFNAGIVEGVLLVLGTLIWGFGDILLVLIL